MKGVELYSWQEGRDWFYALLPGTNAEPVRARISQARVKGVPRLEERLGCVPAGAMVFWNSRKVSGMRFKRPPRHVLLAVEQALQSRGLKLVK